MKIGRVKLKVREFRTETTEFNIETDGEIEEFKESATIAEHPSADDDIACRYCYTPDSTVDNPLVGLCKCSGHIKYVHYLCLK